MEKISAILADRHLKPADLARMTGFSPSRLSKWFSGEGVPSVYQAAAFAKSLGVPLEWLADDQAPPVPPPGLSEDDRMVLKMARAIGDPEEAMRRLVVPSGLPDLPRAPNNSAPGTKKAGEGPAGNKRRVGG